MRYAIIVGLCFAVAGAAAAGELQKGDNEVAFEAAYSDTDFGSSEGFDLGSTKETDLSLSYGWLVTDHHEFGLVAGYFKQDIDGGDVFANAEVDGTRLGGFYTYNFGNYGNVTPYVGGVISTLGGDLGDSFDLQYAAEVGIKVYPWEHGGFNVGLGYFQLTADAPGLDDADGLNLGIGVLLKY